MAERPIIFSAPMVRALLREIETPGSGKTMTRRLAWRPRKDSTASLRRTRASISRGETVWQRVQPGDVLWVRETFGIGCRPHPAHGWIDGAEYRADGDGALWPLPPDADHESVPGGWRSPIHMPRWASRILLNVTAVKVERLQDISEDDARAEGVEPLHDGFYPYGIATFITAVTADGREVPAQYCPTARLSFEMLWTSLHGPDAWASNPEVVAITFKPRLANQQEQPQ